MNDQIPREFRAHFIRHNRRVLGVAALMLGASLVLWAMLYFLSYWILLLFITLLQGVDATDPTHFFPQFAAVAWILCGISLLRNLLWPFPRLADRHSFGRTVLEMFMALPDMTGSALHTLGAYRSLTDEELFAAWKLMKKIVHDGPVGLQELPVEISGNETRRKVMMALQMTGLVELHKGEEGPDFRVASETGKRLGQAFVRIKVDAARFIPRGKSEGEPR